MIVLRNAKEPDPSFAALIFAYGRYLTIAANRPDYTGEPTNLQGIWNDKIRPPWNSNYTCNINTQMNYWLAEVANLSECHLPLIKSIGELAQTGAEVAREHYGAAAGIAEMLLQSHEVRDCKRLIRILPALPKTWKAGEFKGFKARGGYTVSAAWENGKVTHYEVVPPLGCKSVYDVVCGE